MLSIVVLNFRTPERSVRAAQLARQGLDDEAELILVDNGSADGSARLMGELLPDARVIELADNSGFAAGMNAGMRAAGGECMLLLNSDVEAAPGSVRALLDYVRSEPGVGIAAPALTDEDGRASRSLLIQPTIWRVFVPGLAKLRYRQWRRRLKNEPLEVEAVEGAAVMVTRAALGKVGLMDEGFFFYHEIDEWCARMRDCGLRCVVVPQAGMLHARGGSTPANAGPAAIELRRSWYRLLRKRLGAGVCALALGRDLVWECIETILYAAASLGGGKRARRKLAVHAAVLRWLAMGMPARDDARYIRAFGGWS